MSRDWRLYLHDMVEHADYALEYVHGISFEQLMEDRRTRDAVILNLQIVGEAAKQIPPEIRARAPHVAWGDAARMRDRLVHGYHRVDMHAVWKVLTSELRPLRDGVSDLLAEL